MWPHFTPHSNYTHNKRKHVCCLQGGLARRVYQGTGYVTKVARRKPVMQQQWAPERLVVGTSLPPGPSRGPEAAAAGEGTAAQHSVGSRLRAPRPRAEPRDTRDTACPVRRPRGDRHVNRQLQTEEPEGAESAPGVGAGRQGWPAGSSGCCAWGGGARGARMERARSGTIVLEAAWAAEGQWGGARTEQVLSTGCSWFS